MTNQSKRIYVLVVFHSPALEARRKATVQVWPLPLSGVCGTDFSAELHEKKS